MIDVSQLAMINDDFARDWSDICELPTALITAMVKRAQREGFCITTLANVFHRTIYYEGTSPT